MFHTRGFCIFLQIIFLSTTTVFIHSVNTKTMNHLLVNYLEWFFFLLLTPCTCNTQSTIYKGPYPYTFWCRIMSIDTCCSNHVKDKCLVHLTAIVGPFGIVRIDFFQNPSLLTVVDSSNGGFQSTDQIFQAMNIAFVFDKLKAISHMVEGVTIIRSCLAEERPNSYHFLFIQNLLLQLHQSETWVFLSSVIILEWDSNNPSWDMAGRKETFFSLGINVSLVGVGLPSTTIWGSNDFTSQFCVMCWLAMVVMTADFSCWKLENTLWCLTLSSFPIEAGKEVLSVVSVISIQPTSRLI